MNIASKILKKQTMSCMYVAIQGLALTLIGGFVGVKLLTEGVGKTAENGRGKAGALLKLLRRICNDKVDVNQVMAYIMAGLMVIVVIFGIFYLIKGIYHMIPQNTPLGKSILSQAKNHEGFSDVVSSINTDISNDCIKYGEVYIGREWILGESAMRLNRIRGVFWLNEGEFEFILCCVDDNQNLWAGTFKYQDERENAIKYLRTRYPELVYGDVLAYRSFVK